MKKITAERINRSSYNFNNSIPYHNNHRYISSREMGYRELKVGEKYQVKETCTGETYEVEVLAEKNYEYKVYIN